MITTTIPHTKPFCVFANGYIVKQDIYPIFNPKENGDIKLYKKKKNKLTRKDGIRKIYSLIKNRLGSLCLIVCVCVCVLNVIKQPGDSDIRGTFNTISDI